MAYSPVLCAVLAPSHLTIPAHTARTALLERIAPQWAPVRQARARCVLRARISQGRVFLLLYCALRVQPEHTLQKWVSLLLQTALHVRHVLLVRRPSISVFQALQPIPLPVGARLDTRAHRPRALLAIQGTTILSLMAPVSPVPSTPILEPLPQPRVCHALSVAWMRFTPRRARVEARPTW